MQLRWDLMRSCRVSESRKQSCAKRRCAIQGVAQSLLQNNPTTKCFAPKFRNPGKFRKHVLFPVHAQNKPVFSVIPSPKPVWRLSELCTAAALNISQLSAATALFFGYLYPSLLSMYELKKSLDLFKKGFGLWTTRAKVHQSNWIHFFIHQVLRTFDAPQNSGSISGSPCWLMSVTWKSEKSRTTQFNESSKLVPQIAYLYSATIPLVLEISSVLAAWNKMLPSMGEGVWLCVRCPMLCYKFTIVCETFSGAEGA